MVVHKEQRATVRRPAAPDGAPGPLVHELARPEALGTCGRLFAHIRLAPGEAVAEHGHEGEFEYYYIMSGGGDYLDNGAVVPVGAGDVALCPSGERHGLRNTGDRDIEMIAFIGYDR